MCYGQLENREWKFVNSIDSFNSCVEDDLEGNRFTSFQSCSAFRFENIAF